jgi:hypothetical protein
MSDSIVSDTKKTRNSPSPPMLDSGNITGTLNQESNATTDSNASSHAAAAQGTSKIWVYGLGSLAHHNHRIGRTTNRYCDIVIGDDADHIMISTVGHCFDVQGLSLGSRARSMTGQMLDTTAQQFSLERQARKESEDALKNASVSSHEEDGDETRPRSGPQSRD